MDTLKDVAEPRVAWEAGDRRGRSGRGPGRPPDGRRPIASPTRRNPLQLAYPPTGRSGCSRWGRTRTTSRSAPAASCSGWRRSAAHGLDTRWVVLSADDQRAIEANDAARAFAGVEQWMSASARSATPGSRPIVEAAKAQLIEAIDGFAPDLVLPAHHDVHQDHRLLAELAWQVVRARHLELRDPQVRRRPRPAERLRLAQRRTARRKAELLVRCFPSQGGRAWFRAETFLALLRIRGLEAKAPEGYAEAFHVRKLISERPMRILVTGHLGYIGTVLTPVLLARGSRGRRAWTPTSTAAARSAGRRVPEVPASGRDLRDVDGRRPRGLRRGHPPRRPVERPAGRPRPAT